MSNPKYSLITENPTQTGALNQDDKRMRWFEVGLVLLVAFGGSILRSLYLLKFGPNHEHYFSIARWPALIIQEISGLLLLGYVLSRRGLGLSSLGLRWSARD